MTKLAVPITVTEVHKAAVAIARAAEFGADLVELRVDTMADQPLTVRELVERSPLPCIVTCRHACEGGDYEGDEAQRVALIEAVCEGEPAPAYIDVELACFERSKPLREALKGCLCNHGRRDDIGLILSSHDFERRPADLYQRLERLAETELCRVAKVAWRARSLRDNLEAFELLGQQVKPSIALCMGETGLPSRVLAGKFGALLTFASLAHGEGTAPGQPTIRELKHLFRWNAIRPDTAVFGVIGHPVGHSLSPHIHNAGFDALAEATDTPAVDSPFSDTEAGKGNAVYLPMPIPPEYEHFKATVGSWLDFAPLGFRGASVTIPHKENLLRFVREQGGEIEPLAEAIGAANTLSVRPDGGLHASNTDYAAALDAVCDGLGIARDDLAGREVAVIGAGGAARAILAGFAHHGAAITIYNRTQPKAEALAEQFGAGDATVSAAPLEAVAGSQAEVFINCTPIGMHPNVGDSPVNVSVWQAKDDCSKTVVFDTIYNPIQTRLLREAAAAGCITIPGTEMFVRQGAAQFERWTGRQAPLDVFRQVLADELEARQT